MIINKEYDEFLLITLNALAPYLDNIVIGGGLACALYKFHSYATEAPVVLFTKDIDILSPQVIPVKETSINILLGVAGIKTNYDADQYRYKMSSESPYEIEFICDESGLPTKIKQKSPPVIEIQKDTPAQFINYIDMIRNNAWRIILDKKNTGYDRTFSLNLPNPFNYIFTKSLINADRPRDKKMKDCVYIYNTIYTFRNTLSEVLNEARTTKEKIPKRTFNKAISAFKNLFCKEDAPGYYYISEYAKENRIMEYDMRVVLKVFNNFSKQLEVYDL